MLHACMIDGFGWFRECDYRRSWLFFDEVDYIFPTRVSGLIRYPERLADQLDFKLVKPEFDRALLDYVVDCTVRDLAEPALVEIVRKIPHRDLDIAMRVAVGEIIHLVADKPQQYERILSQSATGVLFLLNKLVIYSVATGKIPIVGRPYASHLLTWKMSRMAQQGRVGGNGASGILSPLQSMTCSALAAGLSMGFVSDAQLEAESLPRLLAFKEKNSSLLGRHQLHLVEASQRYEALPHGPEFERQLAALRLNCYKERMQLEEAGCGSWLQSGAGFVPAALGASGGFLATAVQAFHQGANLPGILVGLLGGASLLASLLPFRSQRPASNFLYLFEAQGFLKNSSETGILRIALDPHELMSSQQQFGAGADLRPLIMATLKTDSDLNAFCLDYFPKVYDRFTNGMDRIEKVSLLIRNVPSAELHERLQLLSA